MVMVSGAAVMVPAGIGGVWRRRVRGAEREWHGPRSRALPLPHPHDCYGYPHNQAPKARSPQSARARNGSRGAAVFRHHHCRRAPLHLWRAGCTCGPGGGGEAGREGLHPSATRHRTAAASTSHVDDARRLPVSTSRRDAGCHPRRTAGGRSRHH
ncbi:hypothetical protein I4F81_010417 [Pyropia yezoensis]|uniref:Uncharacterized protein n=1 Tax=Pyropia yezoensis TaxID=2788 RepID=A0ACC3CD81_PYRYE|nr:hypothetical protein I4F81_010417 [Neopyropia yezoensis]